MKRHLRAVTAAAATITLVGAWTVPAQAGTHRAGNDLMVVANHLNNPRQVAIGPDGGVFVAEAGGAVAAPACPTPDTCYNYSGRVSELKNGKVRTVVEHLLSFGAPDGSGAVGSDGVSVDNEGHVFVQESAPSCTDVSKYSAHFRSQSGRLLQATGLTSTKPLFNVTGFEVKNNPDHGVCDSDPYAVLAGDDVQYVADAAGNDVLEIRGGHVVQTWVLPPTAHGNEAVPTSLAWGPGGHVYVGELTGEEHGSTPGDAQVFRLDSHGSVHVYASGFSAITGLAFGPDASMYVTEFSLDFAHFSPLGDVVKVARNGTRTQLGFGKLFFPAGAAVDGKGHLYVSNFSILPAHTTPAQGFGGANGQLVRMNS